MSMVVDESSGLIKPAAMSTPFLVALGTLQAGHLVLETMLVSARTVLSGSLYTYTILQRGFGSTPASHNPGEVINSASFPGMLTPPGSGEIEIAANNTQGGTVTNVRLRGVRVENPHYSCVSIPPPYADVGSLPRMPDPVPAGTNPIIVNETGLFLVPSTPFVIQIDSEQMTVNTRAPTMVPSQFAYALSSATTMAHPASRGVYVIGTSTLNDVLVEACEFAPGNLDTTVPQVAAYGLTRLTLRDCLFYPQLNGTNMAVFGEANPGIGYVTDLLVDNCRFRGIGAGMLALNCFYVVRAVIQNSTFSTTQSTAGGITLGASSMSALIIGNDLSYIQAVPPVQDSTNSADTISRGNLGYTDRRITTTITGSTTVGPSDDLIFANAMSTGFTVTLPLANGGQGKAGQGKAVTVKKIDTSANGVTIRAPVTNSIDGGPLVGSYGPLTVQNKYATFVSDGTINWYIVANN